MISNFYEYLERVCKMYNEHPDDRKEMLEFYSKQLTFARSEFQMVDDSINLEADVIATKRDELEILLKAMDDESDEFDLLCEVSEILENYLQVVDIVKETD